jgi:phospholipid/cholesterol/gamma-HCH transport system substrate-binding protein
MDRDRRLSIVVGLFALGALVLFAIAVLSLTSQTGPWIPRYPLVAYFQSVQGLIEGAPVRLAGKDVGIVESVAFGPLGGSKPPVEVRMAIDRDVQDRIRSDSRATIGTMGLLGDKYIELSMGSLEGRVLQPGAEVAATTPTDLPEMVEKGTQALDGIAELASNLNQVAQQFREERGAASIAASAKSVSAIVEQVQTGHGLLHSLIYDEYQGGSVENISRSLATLEQILDSIARGHGVLHELVFEPSTQQPLVAHATSAAQNLDQVLAKLDSGEGTLGLLLNDPTLYDELTSLVGGARRSLVVRSLIDLASPDRK